MLVMNGYEFEFDLFELETTRKYEKALKEVNEKIESEEGETLLSESIELQCDEIRKCMDTIFGEGTGVKVCGESYNLTKHLDAFDALVVEATRQRMEHDKRGLKYKANEENLNREQRRYREKQGRNKKQFKKGKM